MPRPSPWDEKAAWNQPIAPVTLPAIRLADLDVEAERKALAERIVERKTIRLGIDAWHAIGKAESFEAWKHIGAALAIGKSYALKVTGANAPWGQNYSREFSDWIKQHGFDKMAKSVRSVAIALHENAPAIEAWRATLPEKQRKLLVHPLSNVRRWRKATQSNGKCPQDLKRDALAGWRRFVSCVELLPQDQSQLLWQAVCAEAAAHQVVAS